MTAEHKLEARVARSAFLADAAEIDMPRRHGLCALGCATVSSNRIHRDALAAIEAQVTARREVLALVDRRVQAACCPR